MEEEPVSFAEAKKHACWCQAMMEEMDSIESRPGAWCHFRLGIDL
jgi:hypothetical protein